MKYHAPDQINRIARLQNEAEDCVREATRLIKEADELTAELKAIYGSQFVNGYQSFKLEHRAIGFMPGNRDWLVGNADVKVIQ